MGVLICTVQGAVQVWTAREQYIYDRSSDSPDRRAESSASTSSMILSLLVPLAECFATWMLSLLLLFPRVTVAQSRLPDWLLPQVPLWSTRFRPGLLLILGVTTS